MIPQLLHRHGCLSALYTDSTSDSLLGKFAEKLARYFGSKGSLARLANRKTGLPKNRVKTNDLLQIKLILNRLLGRSTLDSVTTIFEGSAKQYKKWGVGDADWLYAMFIENYDFTRFAKEQGLKVIVDIYEDPYIWEELLDEISKKEYGAIRHLKEFYEAQAILRQNYIDNILETADKYLVPSEYVKKCLERNPKYDASKVNIIPYASSVNNKKYCNNAVVGRIIWVGNDAVRKGLCYCAEAASILKRRYGLLDFRIIGRLPEGLKKDPFYKDLNFIGYCNKSQLEEEFKKADMFVFPTLAEGFAAVLLEASSFGVPVITTDASGFPSSAPCIFIEKHNVDEIVEAVSSMIENRKARDILSKITFDYSQSIGKSEFGDRLMELLRSE